MAQSYTVKETSLILGFSTNSIYKFLDEGRLKGNRGNSDTGRFKIPHSALEKFLGTALSEAAVSQALATHTYTSMQIKKENVTQNHQAPLVVRRQSEPAPETAIPLKIIRALILVGLIVILFDIIIGNDYSLIQQLMRLALMGILIVLTYQFGGLSHST